MPLLQRRGPFPARSQWGAGPPPDGSKMPASWRASSPSRGSGVRFFAEKGPSAWKGLPPTEGAPKAGGMGAGAGMGATSGAGANDGACANGSGGGGGGGGGYGA